MGYVYINHGLPKEAMTEQVGSRLCLLAPGHATSTTLYSWPCTVRVTKLQATITLSLLHFLYPSFPPSFTLLFLVLRAPRRSFSRSLPPSLPHPSPPPHPFSLLPSACSVFWGWGIQHVNKLVPRSQCYKATLSFSLPSFSTPVIRSPFHHTY